MLLGGDVLIAALLSTSVIRNKPAEAATSGVGLLPATGQFMPLDGTKVLDSRDGTGIVDPGLTPGSTLTFSVQSVAGVATGVPASASAVVLEFNAEGNFDGVLSAGPTGGATSTSLTFPADTERNGFDVVAPAADGTIALAITGLAPIPAGAVMSKVVVRLHGYYTGAAAPTAGSTYVGYDPAELADSTGSPSGLMLDGTDITGPLVVGTPPGAATSNIYMVQVSGHAGVPADGSATAVAVQVIVQNPTCSGGFALVPDGSGRSDYEVRSQQATTTRTSIWSACLPTAGSTSASSAVRERPPSSSGSAATTRPRLSARRDRATRPCTRRSSTPRPVSASRTAR